MATTGRSHRRCGAHKAFTGPHEPPVVRRRHLLGLFAVGVAGCADDPRTATDQSDTPHSPGSVATDDTPPTTADTSDDRDRRTATERNPRPLSPSGAWTHAGGGPARTGSTDTVGVRDTGTPYWRLRRVRSGPVVSDGQQLYGFGNLNADPDARQTATQPARGTAQPIDTERSLVARDAATGTIQWAVPRPGAYGTPVVAGDRVISAEGETVAAHATSDGRRLWRVAIEHTGDRPRPGTPVVADGVVYVPVDAARNDPRVRAYDTNDGTRLWDRAVPEPDGIAVVGDTLVVGGGVYDGPGRIAAYDTADGSRRWGVETTGPRTRPVIADHPNSDAPTIVTNGPDGVAAHWLPDGRRLWQTAVGDGRTPVAVGHGQVYVPGETLTALSATDGAEVWRRETDYGSRWRAPPAVGPEAVYAPQFGAGGRMTVFAPDGGRLWSYPFRETIVEGDVVQTGSRFQPTLLGEAVYVFAAEGLVAFGPE